MESVGEKEKRIDFEENYFNLLNIIIEIGFVEIIEGIFEEMRSLIDNIKWNGKIRD